MVMESNLWYIEHPPPPDCPLQTYHRHLAVEWHQKVHCSDRFGASNIIQFYCTNHKQARDHTLRMLTTYHYQR